MKINIKNLVIAVIVGLGIWFIPTPEGLTDNAWHLFAIFLFVILGIILKAAPMGVMSVFGITLCGFTQILAPEDVTNPAKSSMINALSAFSNTTIWLIGIAFFIARGFIKTGLGTRIAYYFVTKLGKTTLGLSYGLNFADLVLAPAIPSNTARGGGIIYPIMKSISLALGSNTDNEEFKQKAGRFLTLSSYNANLISSSMFLTATASNPMAQKFAADLGINISWGQWALAALIPGLVTFFLMPLLLYKTVAPTIKNTGNIVEETKEKLIKLGALTLSEWLMIGVFILLLVLWVFGSYFEVHPTTAAFIGLGVLLVTGVLDWDDIKSEKGAWDTIVWFSALVMMASYLTKLGFISWVSTGIENSISGLSWQVAFPLIILLYFYLHYLFASATAHVAALYFAILSVGLALGIPGKLLALSLGFCGGIFGTLTHYGHGPAPIFFGSGYTNLGIWWKNGFIVSILFLFCWFIIGAGWWKLIGIW